MLNLKRGQTAAGRRKEKRREKITLIFFFVPQHRRLGQHSKHQQSSKSLSFRVWLSCTLISYAHTINIVCHHLITRESVRNAYGLSRNPISHSCILSLPRTTYSKKRLDFHYDENRVVTERINTERILHMHDLMRCEVFVGVIGCPSLCISTSVPSTLRLLK